MQNFVKFDLDNFLHSGVVLSVVSKWSFVSICHCTFVSSPYLCALS